MARPDPRQDDKPLAVEAYTENAICTGETVSGGLVVANDPLNATDPTGMQSVPMPSFDDEGRGRQMEIDREVMTEFSKATVNTGVKSLNAGNDATVMLLGGGFKGAPDIPLPFDVSSDAQMTSDVMVGVVSAAYSAASSLKSAVDSTTVGRWMSPNEASKMQRTGRVQESTSTLTHVSNPANPNGFRRQAPSGSVYTQFDVPSSSLRPSGTGTSTIPGPNARIKPASEMPRAANIEILEKKP